MAQIQSQHISIRSGTSYQISHIVSDHIIPRCVTVQYSVPYTIYNLFFATGSRAGWSNVLARSDKAAHFSPANPCVFISETGTIPPTVPWQHLYLLQCLSWCSSQTVLSVARDTIFSLLTTGVNLARASQGLCGLLLIAEIV